MKYKISDVNRHISEDAGAFIASCESEYLEQVQGAADVIAARLNQNRVVLLSGPSGSGKTTTAYKLQHELENRGIVSHTISIDDYFQTFNLKTFPRTPEGELDFESPLCVDMELLNEHFTALNEGREILVPHYIFRRQKRSASIFKRLHLKDNEIAIFEGIHALNDDITKPHPEAVKLYVSTAADFIEDNYAQAFSGTWLRLLRRAVRDNNFRGTNASSTIELWAGVLRGEMLYIDPYKHRADITIDSTLPYEVSVMKDIAIPLFLELPENNSRRDELAQILPALNKFAPIPQQLVPEDSILREFIGGSIYFGKRFI